jgi:hypothetical protein
LDEVRADERKRLREGAISKVLDVLWEFSTDDDHSLTWYRQEAQCIVAAIFVEEEKKATLVHHDMDPTLPSKHDRNRDGLD